MSTPWRQMAEETLVEVLGNCAPQVGVHEHIREETIKSLEMKLTTLYQRGWDRLNPGFHRPTAQEGLALFRSLPEEPKPTTEDLAILKAARLQAAGSILGGLMAYPEDVDLETAVHKAVVMVYDLEKDL